MTTEKTNLVKAMKDQNNMALTEGARKNAHGLVVTIMTTSKEEKKRVDNLFVW